MILWSGGLWLGVCELTLPWKNNLRLYINNEIYNSIFSTLTMLSTTAISHLTLGD